LWTHASLTLFCTRLRTEERKGEQYDV